MIFLKDYIDVISLVKNLLMHIYYNVLLVHSQETLTETLIMSHNVV